MAMLKDSYGNPIPSYLFYTFEEIHIIDSRYFTPNLKTYVRENKITDLILANNITFACSHKTINAYKEFLTQQPGRVNRTNKTSTNTSTNTSKKRSNNDSVR